VNQAIEDRIGNGGIPNTLMPVFDGKMAGENGGATAVKKSSLTLSTEKLDLSFAKRRD